MTTSPPTEHPTPDQTTFDQTASDQPTLDGQPTLSGRDIGVAYFAISGVRDWLLNDVGMTFEDSLLLAAVADGRSAARDDLVTVLVTGLKIASQKASEHIDRMIGAGLATEADGTVTSTPAGAQAHAHFSARVAQNVPKLYGGIADEDLATTQRVLATVTERANRELALTLRP